MPSLVQNVHKKNLTPKNIADLIDDEIEAIEQYDDALNDTDDADEIETIQHIRDEEEEHIEELDGMGKMVDEMDSEQAWEDFKSGYTDFIENHVSSGQVNKSKDGEPSSIEGKLDTLLAIQQEQRVDLERLTDVIPQLKGDIEEERTDEEAGEEGDPMADLFGGADEGGMPMDDAQDDFSDIPDDEDDYTDDEIAMMDEDGEEATEDDDSDYIDDEGDAEVVEGDGSDNEDVEGTDDDEESDDDYIPIEDIMSEDDDEEESDDEDDDEEESDEELLEKMVMAISKLNKTVQKLTAQVEHLEKQNRALKKSITVQPMHAHGSRPTPIRKQVGVVSKPPVGVGYTANQIGGVDDLNPFSKSTPQQILDRCNRVARL